LFRHRRRDPSTRDSAGEHDCAVSPIAARTSPWLVPGPGGWAEAVARRARVEVRASKLVRDSGRHAEDGPALHCRKSLIAGRAMWKRDKTRKSRTEGAPPRRRAERHT
jgi:hypothetical protein